MPSYKLDQRVILTGKRNMEGTVTFFEDGILEVTTDSGVPFEFYAPFSDVKPKPDTDHPSLEQTSDFEDIAPVIQAIDDRIIAIAKLLQAKAGGAVTQLGGSVAPWNKLTTLQKLNFVAIATGIDASDWQIAFKEGRMTSMNVSGLFRIGSALAGRS